MITKGKYTFFFKDKINQWTRSLFTVNGVVFNCVEQAVMAEKAVLFGDMETCALILNTDNPAEQQRLGRLVKNFDQAIWDQNKEAIYYFENCQKFIQNPELKEVLFSTGDTELVECNPDDFIWSCGLSIDDPNARNPSDWKGQNLLGRVLQRVRDDLREKERQDGSK